MPRSHCHSGASVLPYWYHIASRMNSRFAVAVHILTFLHEQQGQPATSELIASSVNTNPSLIRRLVLQLAKAGLTTSQMGTGGGTSLARPATDISLLDVYRAVETGEVFGLPREQPNPKCPSGATSSAP